MAKTMGVSDMECPFVVGQKVVCVNDEEVPVAAIPGAIFLFFGLNGLTRGCVYTVREVYQAEYSLVPLVKVREIYRPDADDGYSALRFRPLVERGTETGMSILRDLLNKTDKPVEVVA